MKKFGFTLLLVCLVLIPYSGTLAQGDNILLYGGQQDIDNIDPAIGENYSINAALRSLYDPLFLPVGAEIVPHLVESYEVSDDATVWTFKLV
ncbi:MAG: hypothetical protein AAF653_02240, partial [Chloroflexota bacterium]